MQRGFVLFVAAVVSVSVSVFAQMPSTMGFQGVLTDGGGNPVADGAYNVTFRMYDAASGGSPLWAEAQNVTAVNGVFVAVLGSVTPIALAFDGGYWLGVEPEGAGGELAPRVELTPSAYAHRARTAEGLALRIQENVDIAGPLAAMKISNISGPAINGSSENDTGIKAAHTSSLGASPGILGETYSNSPAAVGIRGVVNTNTGGAAAAGVVGENKSVVGTGYGVWGAHLSAGWGVYGSSVGRAVVGFSGGSTADAIGVYGETNSAAGAGVKATGSDAAGTALEVQTGAIKVTGAGVGTDTPAFVHQTTALNTSGGATTIDHPLLDGDPDAIVIVTHNWNPGGGGSGTDLNQSVGVKYDDGAGKWQIYLEDSANSMPTGIYFNVLVVKP